MWSWKSTLDPETLSFKTHLMWIQYQNTDSMTPDSCTRCAVCIVCTLTLLVSPEAPVTCNITEQCNYWLWITMGSKYKHAFMPLSLRNSSEQRAQMECWPSKTFNPHQTASSADWANVRRTATSWRSSPLRTWYHYWSFTVHWSWPFSHLTHSNPCVVTHIMQTLS